MEVKEQNEVEGEKGYWLHNRGEWEDKRETKGPLEKTLSIFNNSSFGQAE